MHLPMVIKLITNNSEVKTMNKKKEVKKDKDKKQIADKYSKKITYSTSENEKLDLLDIVEMYLCKSCVRI